MYFFIIIFVGVNKSIKKFSKKYLSKFNTLFKKTIPKFGEWRWGDNGTWQQNVTINKILVGRIHDNKKRPLTHYYGADYSNPFIVENIRSFIYSSKFPCIYFPKK